MKLFSMDLDGMRFEDVEQFCNLNISEHMRLDYKAQLSSTEPGAQVAKIVSSFANTQGGLVIFG